MCFLLDLSENFFWCVIPGMGLPILFFAHFPSGILVFYLLLGRDFFFILDIDPLLLDTESIFLTLFLILSMMSTVENKSLILVWTNPLLFHLTVHASGGLFKKSPMVRPQRYSP